MIDINKPPRDFQVGDTVFSLQYGFATIISIDENRRDMYAIRTSREGLRYQPTFTPCGRYYDDSKYRIWFLKEEVEFIFKF